MEKAPFGGLFCMHRSVDRAEFRQRPDTEEDLSNDLVLCDAAHLGASRIDGGGALITHHEPLIFRHLEGQIQVAGAEGLFHQVWLVDRGAVNDHCPVVQNVDPVARAADHSFYQNLVVVVKRDDVARL